MINGFIRLSYHCWRGGTQQQILCYPREVRRALRNHGHLTLAGSDAAPVTLTSAQVNKKANDGSGLLTTGPGALTEAGYTVVEYAADALAFTAGAGGTVDHATLRRNQNGLAVRGGAASGDLTQDSHPVIHNSNLYDNGNYQVDARDFADPSVTLDATGNGWGGTDPAVIDRDIYDHQDDARSPTVAWQDTRLSAPTTALPHQIAITQPANGIATSDAVLTVRGTLDAQLASAFTVNGYGVTLAGNTFRATVPLSIGVNTITAQAVSPQGQVAEDAITVTRLDTGVISLAASPATGYDPLPVTFTINNASGNAITHVAMDYYGDGVIDETFNDALTVSHTYVDGGQFSAVAYLTDSAGTTYLASTSISVQRHADQPLLSDLSFVSPLNQAMIAGNTILVQGRYAGPDQATITLNGQPVLRYQDRWYVNNVHLSPGANTLTARAVSDDGQTAETIITVTSTAVSPVTVAIDHESGLIPLVVTLTINNPGNLPLNHVSVDFDGDGTFEIDTSDLSIPLTHTFDKPGDAVMTVTVGDGNGGMYVAKVAVVVEESAEQLDAGFRALFSNLLTKLGNGDIAGALLLIAADMRPHYESVFTALVAENDMTQLVKQLGTLDGGTLFNGYAEYAIVREENGQVISFPIHFVVDTDGAWRVGGF